MAFAAGGITYHVIRHSHGIRLDRAVEVNHSFRFVLILDGDRMTRGNQRETDRLKAQKKAAANKAKPKESAASLQQRREHDAELLRQKQKKKEEERAALAAAGGGGGTKK